MTTPLSTGGLSVWCRCWIKPSAGNRGRYLRSDNGLLLTAKRDAAAALRFFRRDIRHHGEPEVVTIDKSGANTAALATLNAGKEKDETITIRQSKYLNNLIEQDHRNIKRRIRLILGFKLFRRAQVILDGIELIYMIRKGQYQHSARDGISLAEPFYLIAA